LPGGHLGAGPQRRYIARMNEIIQSEAATTQADPLDILIAPHAMLRQKTRIVRPEDVPELRPLLPRMFAAMYQAPGIGLAAPQVGLGLRFAIVDLMENEVPAPLTLVNPEIIAASDTLVAREEGCLSLPNQYAEVVRPQSVRVRYQDLDGTRHELDADGLLATCLQHEIDHLDGVLFVDHISALKRNMLMRRLAKEQKNKAPSQKHIG
jgi:peptide deformylase